MKRIHIALAMLIIASLACNLPLDTGSQPTAPPAGTLPPEPSPAVAGSVLLHGLWRRTDAEIRMSNPVPGQPDVTAPFKILGTTLRFDEPSGVMTEGTTTEYYLEGASPEWACNFAGAYKVNVAITYEASVGTDVSGTVAWQAGADLPPENTIEPWRNECTFQSSSTPPILASTLHVPVAATPRLSLTFELTDAGNTLTVSIAFQSSDTPAISVERIYVYERVE